MKFLDGVRLILSVFATFWDRTIAVTNLVVRSEIQRHNFSQSASEHWKNRKKALKILLVFRERCAAECAIFVQTKFNAENVFSNAE